MTTELIAVLYFAAGAAFAFFLLREDALTQSKSLTRGSRALYAAAFLLIAVVWPFVLLLMLRQAYADLIDEIDEGVNE